VTCSSGAIAGVLERLGEQAVARGEVVVQESGRDAGLHRDPRDPDVVDALAFRFFHKVRAAG